MSSFTKYRYDSYIPKLREREKVELLMVDDSIIEANVYQYRCSNGERIEKVTHFVSVTDEKYSTKRGLVLSSYVKGWRKVYAGKPLKRKKLSELLMANPIQEAEEMFLGKVIVVNSND